MSVTSMILNWRSIIICTWRSGPSQNLLRILLTRNRDEGLVRIGDFQISIGKMQNIDTRKRPFSFYSYISKGAVKY